MQSTKQIILGVDPGTIKMGFAIVSSNMGLNTLIDFGVINLKYFESHHEKLNQIYKQIINIIQKYSPQEFAIEAPFFGKNVQSMLKLGRAQGVAISAAFSNGINTFEYSPREIKKAIAGNGNASKEQIARMIEMQFHVDLKQVPLDATDAIAVAFCHAFNNKNFKPKSALKGWESYMKLNPNKVIKL